MADHDALGQYLRKCRLSANFTLRKAAEKLSVSPAYLSRIELEQRANPAAELLRRMAKLYSISVYEIERRALRRQDDLMMADPASILAREFYILTRERSTDELERALRAFVEILGLDSDQRDKFKAGLPEILRRMKEADADERSRLIELGFAVPGEGQLDFDFERLSDFVSTLTFGQIRELARNTSRELLQRAKLKTTLPIPIETLIEADESVHIRVNGDSAHFRNNSERISGVARFDVNTGRREIEVSGRLFCSTSEDDRRQLRWVLAHEFAHCRLHLRETSAFAGSKCSASTVSILDQCDSERRLVIEQQANEFAYEFVMPEKIVRSIVPTFFPELKSEITFAEAVQLVKGTETNRVCVAPLSLEALFGVPATCVVAWLRRLGFIRLAENSAERLGEAAISHRVASLFDNRSR